MKRSDARTYWAKIKGFLGLGKGEQQIPLELKREEEVVEGEEARKAWREGSKL